MTWQSYCPSYGIMTHFPSQLSYHQPVCTLLLVLYMCQRWVTAMLDLSAPVGKQESRRTFVGKKKPKVDLIIEITLATSCVLSPISNDMTDFWSQIHYSYNIVEYIRCLPKSHWCLQVLSSDVFWICKIRHVECHNWVLRAWLKNNLSNETNLFYQELKVKCKQILKVNTTYILRY